MDTSQSKMAWSRIVGVSEASIRRHLAHPADRPVGSLRASEAQVDEILSNYDIPIEAVTSRGMSIRDPETGSWQKVSWLPNIKALHESKKYDDLVASLEGWEPTTPELTHGVETIVINAADLQIGKAMQRGGGSQETVSRVGRSIAKVAGEILEAGGAHKIILADNGDPIENCFNVPSQLVTNDLSVPEQIRVFRRLMLEAIKVLAPLAIEFEYVVVPSNHGAHRTGYKSPGGTVDADFGLEISYQLEDCVSGVLDNVTFVRPASLDETAVTTATDGTKIAFHHGHQAAGPNGQGKWWAGQDHGRMAGWDADILVTAHYHSLAVEHSGNGRWIMRCSSSDVGSDWFTNKTGEAALAGMTVFEVEDGQWKNLRIV